VKTIGIDIGSSFIKVSVFDAEKGRCLSKASVPETEMPIRADHKGWAEQSPEMWWDYARQAVVEAIDRCGISALDIGAIGITYQMHGLVCLDRDGKLLRPSIIWCDSRAVETGNMLAQRLGADYCRSHLLNSPGNFTASKLCWVKENEPALFEKIYRVMLPGDYIGYRLTGEINTTVSGLSEGIFWDFPNHRVSEELLTISGISKDMIAPIVPTFGEQGRLLPAIARELGLKPGIPVTYRAGDQPNNAFSLNVINPGEVAATAGTSGVVYGVTDRMVADPLYRINAFAHVNHSENSARLGILLCINGTGILNSWLRKNIAGGKDYVQMNDEAMKIPAGSDGLMIVPFGNGAERMLQNRETGCQVVGLNYNKHTQSHVFRAAQEGIAFAFRYGMEAMNEAGISPKVIKAGNANMFLSPVFRQVLADITGICINLYETDGSTGAAMGAATGEGYYSGFSEAGAKMKKIKVIEPSGERSSSMEAYGRWKSHLDVILNSKQDIQY
jgi:xylulokinase